MTGLGKLMRRTAAVGVGCALVVGGLSAAPASAATTPGWQPDANALGSLGFYNASGTQIYSGSTTATPMASYYAVATTSTVAFAATTTPEAGNSATWSGTQQITSAQAQPKSGLPGGLASFSGTVVADDSAASFKTNQIDTFPNNLSTAGYQNLYEVRVYINNNTSKWYATDISVDTATNTWTQVYPAPPSATAPGAPTGVGATAHDASADVSWTAPASDGGIAITKYTVTAVPTTGTGTITKDVTGATSTTLTGLTNGKTYNVTVTATNSVGTGPASSPAVTVSPTAAPTAPGAPTGVSATAGDTTANVSWTAPASDGGSAITKYTVTAHPSAGADVTKDVTGATSTQLTGLTNGTQYAVTVTATNAVGTSPASSPAVNVTPKAPTAPGAPTGVSATAGDTTANVSWTAPASDGGSAITKYTVTAHPSAGADVTKDVTGATSTQLTGLTNGTQYAVTVTATNAVGTSPASSPAVNVTPKAPTAPEAPTGVTATPADSAANVSWTAPADNGGSAITKYTVTAHPAVGADVTKDVTGATSTQLTGLTNGTQYAVTVTATNAVGTSPASSPAVDVTPAVTAVNTGLSLSVSAPVVTAGDAFEVSGRLVGGSAGGKAINLQQTTPGSAPVTTVITTDETGRFTVTVAAVYNASYKATFDGNDTQKPAASPVRSVQVRSRVTVFHPTASNTRTTNRTITVTGRVYPALNGSLVTLVLRGANGNTQLAQAHVNSVGNFTLTRTVGKGTYLLQVGIGATPKNVAGASRLFRVYEV